MTVPPTHCPTCGAELYPVRRMRPAPRMPPAGLLLMAAAVVTAFGVYWGLALFIRSLVHIRAWVLALPLLAVALACALPIARAAYRFPGVVTLRCGKCGWAGRHRVTSG